MSISWLLTIGLCHFNNSNSIVRVLQNYPTPASVVIEEIVDLNGENGGDDDGEVNVECWIIVHTGTVRGVSESVLARISLDRAHIEPRVHKEWSLACRVQDLLRPGARRLLQTICDLVTDGVRLSTAVAGKTDCGSALAPVAVYLENGPLHTVLNKYKMKGSSPTHLLYSCTTCSS
ncbi:hypothetical protein Sjap_023168 [Stephania japonica]|uniref:Uncharacterized protein n=1 Tax=Stephania japonica TaxID=461633 RepID=A0AAP0EB42_9MAGN